MDSIWNLCGICGVHLESMGECKVHRPTYKCQCALGWTAALPYDTSRLWFPSHLLAASDSSPIRVRLLQQVRGSCSYYSVRVVNFVCLRICPVFFPHTQTGYECMFLFLACFSFTIAGTPKHQCLLCLYFCLLVSCRDAAVHQHDHTR